MCARQSISAVSIVRQFLNAPCDSHWNSVIRILRCLRKMHPEEDYYMKMKVIVKSYVIQIFVIQILTGPGHCQAGDPFLDIMSWRRNQQNKVAVSGAEFEYCAMTVALKKFA